MFIQNEYIKMAVINSYYLYQRYEKRGNQPWIPSYPNTWSIDGDGTMPLVLKEQDDPSCYHPIYRWVQTEDTICVDATTIQTRTTSGDPYCNGYDKYVDTTTEQSFDGGITWEFVSSASTLVEQDSEYCGYHPTPEVQYRWTQSGTTCDNANKYKRYIKQVSYDGGYAWIVVTPPQYSAGTLVEQDSYDCGYRTSATTSATYCSNANQYVDVYSLVSRDYGTTWTTASTSTELVDSDVYECGYRTRTTTGDTYCSNANQYAHTYNEVSRDSGNTWTTASTSSVLVQSDSYDCGYRTGTTSSSTYCNGDDLYVDVYYRVSRDYGTTWTTASTTPTLVEAGGCATPTPTGGKFTLTLSDSSTVTAECDSTSAVTSGEVATQYSGSVVSAVIGDCVTTISGRSFSGCSHLTGVTIGSGVTTIQGHAFGKCYALRSVTFDNGSNLDRLDTQAFYYCYSLRSVVIPSGTTYIGISVFEHCHNLSAVTIPSTVTDVQYGAFRFCYNLKSVTLPSTQTSIGNYTFQDCYSLTSITIPNSVTEIKQTAFSGCTGFTTIEIPSAVTVIGSNAFNGCTSLQSITCLATRTPSLGSSVFDNTNDCPIYVPSGSVNDYKAVWSSYSSRIQAIPNS